MNIPTIFVGRAESARRFVRLKVIITAALLKPPYRVLGIVQLNSAFCTLHSALICQGQILSLTVCGEGAKNAQIALIKAHLGGKARIAVH